MSLSPSLNSVVSRIVREEPVSTAELQEAGNALLSKQARKKSKKAIPAKIQNVIARQAHNMELRRKGLAVAGKPPFRFIKKRPEIKTKLNAVILKALVKKEEELKKDKPEPVADKVKPAADKVKPEADKDKPVPAADKAKPELPVALKEEDEAFRKEYEKLEALRLPNPDAELARLRKNPKIHAIFNEVTKRMSCSREHLIALGHAVEVRERFGDKYYVFIHGQNPQHMMLNLAAKRLQEIFKAAPVWEGATPLRHPCFTKHVQPHQTPEWFSRQCNVLDRGDFNFTRELICADAYFASTALQASANYFTAPGRPNFGAGREFIQNLLRAQLQDCLPGRDIQPLLDVFMRLHDEIPSYLKAGGNMYVMCVPKEKFKETGFLSTCLGKTCSSCRGKVDTAVLKQLQEDDLTGFGRDIPQVRLLTHKLTPEEGVKIFQESTLPKELISHVDDVIYESIARFFVGEEDLAASTSLRR